MAKKGKRKWVKWTCQAEVQKANRGKAKCSRVNYSGTTNTFNTPLGEFPLRQRFCGACRKRTPHKVAELKK